MNGNNNIILILESFKHDLFEVINNIDLNQKTIRIPAPKEIQIAFNSINTPFLKFNHTGLNKTMVVEEIGMLILENDIFFLEIALNNYCNSTEEQFEQRMKLVDTWINFWRELFDKIVIFSKQIQSLIKNYNNKPLQLAKKLEKLSLDKELNLSFFTPFLQELKEIGLEISFHQSWQNNLMLFPIATNNGLRFIEYKEAMLQKIRNDIQLAFEKFNHSSDIEEWFKQKIKHASSKILFILDNNQHLLLHINDFIKSEDFPIIKKFLKKISLENMLERSQKWLKEIAKRKYIEKENDIECIFKTNKYNFVKLLTFNALDREGALLSHCLGRGGYDEYLKDNSRIFYSMRNQANEPIVTIEYDPQRRFIIQVQSYKNTCPLPEMAKYLQEFFKFLFPNQLVGFYNTTVANVIGYEQVQIHAIKMFQKHPGFFIYTKKQENEFKHFPLMNPIGTDYKQYKKYLMTNLNDELRKIVQQQINQYLFNNKYYPIEIINLKNKIFNEYYNIKKIFQRNKIDFQIHTFFKKDEDLLLLNSFKYLKIFIENRDLQMKNREKILLRHSERWRNQELKEDRLYLNMLLNMANLINNEIGKSIPKDFMTIQTTHLEGYLGNNSFIKEFYVDLPEKLKKIKDLDKENSKLMPID